jgi:predicted transcriptional regulator
LSTLEVEKIGSMRRKIGITQTQLAKLSGVSQSLIAKIESGRIDPAYSKVKQIFEALEHELENAKVTKKARDIMSAHLVSVNPEDTLTKVMRMMKQDNISQIPVFEGGNGVGSVSDDMIVDWLTKYEGKVGMIKVKDVMKESFPVVPEETDVEGVAGLLKFYKAVLVWKSKSKGYGIITKADLIKAIK